MTMKRKGIILAGGSGTRLYPLTTVVSKQLMPVYDKPLIYYPLSILMLAGIRDILIISTPKDLSNFETLLKDGEWLGLSIQYAEQKYPDGLAQALIIAEEFLNGSPSALILGDNIFHGDNITSSLKSADCRNEGSTIFAYKVINPSQYGVVELDSNRMPISIEEKPNVPRSPYAVTGLYFYDNSASELAKSLRPSMRGELEITDLNRLYMQERRLYVEVLGKGSAWLDAGTHSDLLDAGQYIRIIEERQGLKVACIEEIAYRLGYIDREELNCLATSLIKNGYGKYLLHVLEEEKYQ